MERYEFVATTTNKEKMINVIIPIVMVGLLVGLALVSYYFELDNYIKPYSLFKIFVKETLNLIKRNDIKFIIKVYMANSFNRQKFLVFFKMAVFFILSYTPFPK